jgi:hypothetical protein
MKSHKLFLVSLGVLILMALALLIQLFVPGYSGVLYYVAAGAIVLISFAFLLQPFAGLSLVLIYLVSPIPFILDVDYSAAITVLLIGNCFAANVLNSSFKVRFQRGSLRIPLLLGSVAAISVIYGVATGNRVSVALGDFYQVIEFAMLFLLAQMLVKTEQQFRILVYVIIAAIVANSVLEMANALMDARHLPHLNQRGIDVARPININAPIALITLLATLAFTKSKKWVIAGIAILSVNIIWSFTRGLWLASLVSAVFLLMIQGGKARRMVLKFAFVSCLVSIPILYVSGLGTAIADRIGYSVVQFDSASAEDQVQSGRRVLEYILILPQIADHPIMGKGLGATFEIAGDAVLEGPKGEQVDHHYIHDLYLLVAFRLGLPALFIFLVLLWKYFRRSIRNLRNADLSPYNAALTAGLIAAVFGEVVLSLTSPTFLNHPTAGIIGCIMAITTTRLRPNLQPLPQS